MSDRLHEVAQHIADHGLDADSWFTLREVAAESLKVTDSPRIIRTLAELVGLDPKMILMNKWGDLFDIDNIYSGIGLEEDHDYYFPCVSVATGAQVRAARKALEEEGQ